MDYLLYFGRPSRCSSWLWVDLPILVTFMRADTEVSLRTSSAYEPGSISRVAILVLLCALGTEAVHRCNTVEVRSAW